jgi:hypothetical protein
MPDTVKQVPLTNNELQIIINTLRTSTPAIGDEKVIFELVQKLEMMRRL